MKINFYKLDSIYINNKNWFNINYHFETKSNNFDIFLNKTSKLQVENVYYTLPDLFNVYKNIPYYILLEGLNKYYTDNKYYFDNDNSNKNQIVNYNKDDIIKLDNKNNFTLVMYISNTNEKRDLIELTNDTSCNLTININSNVVDISSNIKLDGSDNNCNINEQLSLHTSNINILVVSQDDKGLVCKVLGKDNVFNIGNTYDNLKINNYLVKTFVFYKDNLFDIKQDDNNGNYIDKVEKIELIKNYFKNYNDIFNKIESDDHYVPSSTIISSDDLYNENSCYKDCIEQCSDFLKMDMLNPDIDNFNQCKKNCKTTIPSCKEYCNTDAGKVDEICDFNNNCPVVYKRNNKYYVNISESSIFCKDTHTAGEKYYGTDRVRVADIYKN